MDWIIGGTKRFTGFYKTFIRKKYKFKKYYTLTTVSELREKTCRRK